MGLGIWGHRGGAQWPLHVPPSRGHMEGSVEHLPPQPGITQGTLFSPPPPQQGFLMTQSSFLLETFFFR